MSITLNKLFKISEGYSIGIKLIFLKTKSLLNRSQGINSVECEGLF